MIVHYLFKWRTVYRELVDRGCYTMRPDRCREREARLSLDATERAMPAPLCLTRARRSRWRRLMFAHSLLRSNQISLKPLLVVTPSCSTDASCQSPVANERLQTFRSQLDGLHRIAFLTASIWYLYSLYKIIINHTGKSAIAREYQLSQLEKLVNIFIFPLTNSAKMEQLPAFPAVVPRILLVCFIHHYFINLH